MATESGRSVIIPGHNGSGGERPRTAPPSSSKNRRACQDAKLPQDRALFNEEQPARLKMGSSFFAPLLPVVLFLSAHTGKERRKF